MMRKFLFLSAIAVIFAACQSKTEYTVNGEVTDPAFEGQQVSLMKTVDNEMQKVDSATITNGKFEFKGNTETSALRFVNIGEPKPRSNTRTLLMLEPGNINLKYDSDFEITGTPLNNAFNDYNAKQKELNTILREYSEQYNAGMTDGTLTEELKEKIQSDFDETVEKTKGITFEFVKANIDNELGQYHFIAASNMFDTEQQKEILAVASEEFKADKNVKRILDLIEAQEAVAIGKKFIDFTMQNPEGETVSLSDYAGKGNYVFIDFWASWCGPCIGEMPNVVDAYEKYKSKGFDVVGVSLDDNKDNWIQGIKDLKMTWPQMSEVTGWETEAVKLYAITGIPHTILLDREGVIIAKDLRGKQLHDKLAELLD